MRPLNPETLFSGKYGAPKVSELRKRLSEAWRCRADPEVVRGLTLQALEEFKRKRK